MTEIKKCFLDQDRPCDLTCKAAFEVDDPLDNVRVWRTLPEMYWNYPVVRLRPGAEELLTQPRATIQSSGGPKPMPMMATVWPGLIRLRRRMLKAQPSGSPGNGWPSSAAGSCTSQRVASRAMVMKARARAADTSRVSRASRQVISTPSSWPFATARASTRP